jgi:hypothetical protein
MKLGTRQRMNPGEEEAPYGPTGQPEGRSGYEIDSRTFPQEHYEITTEHAKQFFI